MAKSQTLKIEFFFLQDVPGEYTSLFLDKDQLKIVLRARKVPEAFENRAPGPSSLVSLAPRLSPVFSLAVFRTAPHLTYHLEEIMDLVVRKTVKLEY